jgi:protein-tyrosine phosphatase
MVDKKNNVETFIDIHCHCLPGLDDGPATMAEAIALCRCLADEGISTVAATPHQLGRFDGRNNAAHVRQTVRNLNEKLNINNIPVHIVPGAEVRVDERICQLLESDLILTLADGGRYILLELPNEIFIDIEPLLEELAYMGIQSIISHAERIAAQEAQAEILQSWLEYSAHFQITASSLIGDFGPELEKAAWGFLTSGQVTLVATDSHDTYSRKPKMKAAFKRISTVLGRDIAHLVCIENPSRILSSRDILPVWQCNSKEAKG